MIGHLMLIDDNDIDHTLYRRLIDKSGLVENVHCFTMATDALAYLNERVHPKIDVILLDINMPRMNGFEFLDEATRLFGSDFARITVVMLTTSLSEQDRVRADRYEVVRDYIHKPLELSHLEQMDAMLDDG